MSTVDPVARDSDPAVAGRKWRTWLAGMAGTAAVAGYGSSIVGDFPGSSVGFGVEEPFAVVKMLLALGGFAATLLLAGVVVRLPARPGLTGQQTFVLAIMLLAFDCGFFVGSFLPTSFRRFADTDLSETRFGMRVACALIVLVAAAMVAWGARKERRKQAREWLRGTETRVSAEVTEVHDTGITNNNAPWVRLTVRFTDEHGTARFVRRRMSVSRFDGPSVGDQISLWYDPADPGNEKKIVIGER